MDRFTAVIANTEKDLDGECFSKECLEQMAQVDQVSVTIAFRGPPVGIAQKFQVHDDGTLSCEGEIDKKISLDGIYPVVGFLYDGVNESGEYLNPKLSSVGLTPEPATLNTKIERVGE
jgi:hypothetical protein